MYSNVTNYDEDKVMGVCVCLFAVASSFFSSSQYTHFPFEVIKKSVSDTSTYFFLPNSMTFGFFCIENFIVVASLTDLGLFVLCVFV